MFLEVRWMQRSQGERPSGTFERRYQLMVETIVDIIKSDEELRLCEGLRLLEATRGALARMDATSAQRFDREVLPGIRSCLLERFGIDPRAGGAPN